ncbi:fungal-specific transcription factor domain-containing [Lecanosticta acicola]|uniref:Fungal-specific transcription factor domain-containing n=1 Tax=Lecanosticta acicola TaxID=111012 RepID=A0AAI8YS68_9PEZI|nr:fungal-specific transcription factor domain-containing [Lecanosticta acicola]
MTDPSNGACPPAQTGFQSGLPRSLTPRRSSTSSSSGLFPMSLDTSGQSTPMGSLDGRLARKRAARACDQCRRRKSRCDGQLNCSACRVVGLSCSYGHVIKQARGPSYVAHLEKKVEELEGRIRKASVASEVSTDDAKSPSQSPQFGSSFNTTPATIAAPPTSSVPSLSLESLSFSNYYSFHTSTVSFSDSMVNTITCEPRGKPFGVDILRQLCNHCNQITSPPISTRPESSIKLAQALDCPNSLDLLPMNANGPPLLPAKAMVLRWINIAFSEAFLLWPFVDRPQVERTAFRLYNTNTFGQDENDGDDLALLYALVALGQRVDMGSSLVGSERQTQGLPYFGAAVSIVPLANCDRSLSAVQTVLCLALYLKANAAQMRVHAYVSAATSAALRMGLHEHVPCFPEEEQALRRRVWSSICMLDTFVSTSLGLPPTVPIDQPDFDPFPCLPSTSSDDELLPATAQFHLARILHQAVHQTYSASSAKRAVDTGTYSVSRLGLKNAAIQLDAWIQGCVTLSTPVENMTRSQLLLAYWHAYAQLLLFSPCVHHLADPNVEKGTPEYYFGTRCVQAALKAVKLADLLHKGPHLNEAYFSTIDVLAFAAMTLLVVQLGSSDGSLLGEAIKSGKRAKELLLMLSLQSRTAAECWEALSVCWTSSLKEACPSSLKSPADKSTSAAKPVDQARKTPPSSTSARSMYPKRPEVRNTDSGIGGIGESPTVSPVMAQFSGDFCSPADVMDSVALA